MEVRSRLRRGWAELQHDLLYHLCGYLDHSARWALRSVSAHWREVSTRQRDDQKLVIASTVQHLGNKIMVLRYWRDQAKFHNHIVSFIVTAPVVLKDLASLLEDLTSQLHMMSSCRIRVTLLVAQNSNHIQLWVFAQQIAISAHLLEQYQLTLGISVKAATQATTIPAPGILQPLKAFLCQFDTYSIPTDQLAASGPTSADCGSQIEIAHLSDLQASKCSVCTFYITSDHGMPIHQGVVAAVASMTHLTKLHVTIGGSSHPLEIDLQPLAQLSLVTDLALQINNNTANCCNGVIRSNEKTLQFVSLTAGMWTAATYCSLQHVAHLKVFNLTIMENDTAQAQALGGITAQLFRLTLHGVKSAGGFQALHDSQPRMHELTLRNPVCCDFHRLPELPFLQRLTLRECIHLTGKSLPSYPQVQELALIDCPRISGVGLQHIIRTALPALAVFSVHVTAQYGLAMQISVRALNALHFGRNLHSIDLRGVSGLTGIRLANLDFTMHRKQVQDKMQPYVKLLMPSPPLDKPEAVLETSDAMLLPNLFKLPTWSSPYVNRLDILR